MRRIVPILTSGLLAIAACTDDGVNPIVTAAFDEVNPWKNTEDAPAEGVAPPNRAAIETADIATIRARLLADERPSYLFAASDNGGYITYTSSLRQSLTMRGSQVTGSRGLGFDLLSATSSQPDPLTRAIPVQQWPALVTRSYEFPADAPRGVIETFECRFEVGEPTELVILQQRHQGYEITEICEGPSGAFENLHLADVRSGFVWRSIQWIGPRQGLIDVEIVLPYTGD